MQMFTITVFAAAVAFVLVALSLISLYGDRQEQHHKRAMKAMEYKQKRRMKTIEQTNDIDDLLAEDDDTDRDEEPDQDDEDGIVTEGYEQVSDGIYRKPAGREPSDGNRRVATKSGRGRHWG